MTIRTHFLLIFRGICAILFCGTCLYAEEEKVAAVFDRQSVYNDYLSGNLGKIKKLAEALLDVHPLPDTDPSAADPYAEEHAFTEAVFSLEDTHTELPPDYDYTSVQLQTEQTEREGEANLNAYIRTSLENNAAFFRQDAADTDLYPSVYPAYFKAFQKHSAAYNEYATRYLNMVSKQMNYSDAAAAYLLRVRLLNGETSAASSAEPKDAVSLPENRSESAALCALFNDPEADVQNVRFAKADSYLVVRNQSTVVCLKDGKQLWTRRIPLSSARISSGNTNVLIQNGCVHLICGGKLTAYGLEQGDLRWSASGHVSDCAGPVLHRGMLLVARTETGDANKPDRLELAAVDPGNGRTIATRTLLTNLDDSYAVSRGRGEWMLNDFVIDGDLLYCYHRDGIVFAFDSARFMPLWARKTDSAVTLPEKARCGEIPFLFRDDAPVSIADSERLFVKHPSQKVIHVLNRTSGKLLQDVPSEIGRSFASGDDVFILGKDAKTLHVHTIPSEGAVSHRQTVLRKRAEIIRELSGNDRLAVFTESSIIFFDSSLKETERYPLPAAFHPVGVADDDLYGTSPSGHLFLRTAASHAELPVTTGPVFDTAFRELRNGQYFAKGIYEVSHEKGIHTLYAPGEQRGSGLLIFCDAKTEKGFSMKLLPGVDYAEDGDILFTVTQKQITAIDRKSGSRIGLHSLDRCEFEFTRVRTSSLDVCGGELYFCGGTQQGNALFAANADRIRKICDLPCTSEAVIAIQAEHSRIFTLVNKQLIRYSYETGSCKRISATDISTEHVVCEVQNDEWILFRDTSRDDSPHYELYETASGKSYAVTVPDEHLKNTQAGFPPTLSADGYFFLGRLDAGGRVLRYALHLKMHKLLDFRGRSLPAVFDGKLYALAGCGADIPGSVVENSKGNLSAVIFDSDGKKISETVLPQLVTDEMQGKIDRSKKPGQEYPNIYYGSGTFRHDGKIYHLLTQYRGAGKYYGVTYLVQQNGDGGCELIPMPYFENELFLLSLTDGEKSIFSCDGRFQMPYSAFMRFASGNFKPIETRLVSYEFKLKQDGFPDEFPEDGFVEIGNGNRVCVLRHRNSATFFALCLRDPAALRQIAEMKPGDQLRAETFRDVSGLIERMATGQGESNPIRRVWLIDPNVDSSKYLKSNPLKSEIQLEFELDCNELEYLPESFSDRFGDNFFELILYKTDGTTIPLLSLGNPCHFPSVIHRGGKNLKD